MNRKEYLEILEKAELAAHSYFSDYSAPFSDYMDNPDGKFAIAITKKQYAFNAHPLKSHDSLGIELIKTIRPDLETDSWGNSLNSDEDFRGQNVIAYGYPHYLLINLPELKLLSHDQYEEVKKILLDVRDYNENIDREGHGQKYELLVADSDLIKLSGTKWPKYSKEIDSIISQLEKYITDDKSEANEVIIGKAFSKSKTL